jgi:hypothetical protein
MSGVFQNIDPHPPLRGEDTLAGWRGGVGRSIFWKTPDTALYSTYLCKYFVGVAVWQVRGSIVRKGTTYTALVPTVIGICDEESR